MSKLNFSVAEPLALQAWRFSFTRMLTPAMGYAISLPMADPRGGAAVCVPRVPPNSPKGAARACPHSEKGCITTCFVLVLAGLSPHKMGFAAVWPSLVALALLLSLSATAAARPLRVRRELRALTAEARERVFAAMQTMKATPTAEGRARYGPAYVSYDELVAQHLVASAAPGCDQGHQGPAFATFHRAFGLRFERALMAVDPRVDALPYWDYNVEAVAPDPRRTDLWSWFGGSEGDARAGHAVEGGRFAAWRVRPGAALANYTNARGLLRSPWNTNPSDRVTRARHSCGSQTTFAPALWGLCLVPPAFLEWYLCIEPTVHTWAHSFLGGIWGTERNCSRTECFLVNAVGVPLAWKSGCLDCPASCPAAAAEAACRCRSSPALRCLASHAVVGRAPLYGDFADAWTSPNDPIFFFHHANVDRHLMTWQRARRDQAPHYGFPAASLPCEGHGLRDVVAPAWPFDGALLNVTGPLTNADLIAADGLAQGPYTYDSLV